MNFCQLAIGAERDAMNFWERADAGTLTRTQLTQNIGLSQAELNAANAQVTAAGAEATVYQIGQQVAQLRANDATANANEYGSKSGAWVMHQALQTQLSGGEDGNGDQLNQLADQMMSGSYSLSGDRGTLAAAESLTSARLQNQYQIDTMNRQANELNAAVGQAGAEVTAANARVTAAQASADAASVRVTASQQLLQAFDQQRFTPDVWNALGDRMNDLSQRYLMWALGIAKRMQSAYNFENDVNLHVIRPDYTSSEVHGLLAADTLMADIQSFTYDLITSTAPKPQPLKQTISLSERYAFEFETQLRRTGSMDFQTDLDDFDSVYPGTYAGRIEHVEVTVDGIIPARGVSGALTNAGISSYRTPSASGGTPKQRVQNRETQIISDFDVRADALVDSPDHRQTGIFQGAGLASTWTLSLPKDVNQQLDFNTLVDVRLTFTYRARFDPDLRTAVLTRAGGPTGDPFATAAVPAALGVRRRLLPVLLDRRPRLRPHRERLRPHREEPGAHRREPGGRHLAELASPWAEAQGDPARLVDGQRDAGRRRRRADDRAGRGCDRAVGDRGLPGGDGRRRQPELGHQWRPRA